MTTPELPGASSQPTTPHHQQIPPVPPTHGSSDTSTPQNDPETKKQRNILGLVALIAAVVGFIFACIPGALIVGWILLPIAFILAIVSLFLKDKPKGMSIIALILSIVGTIVGVVVFFSVVASSAKDAFGSGDTKVSAPTTEASDDAQAAEKPADKSGTRENPSPIGSVVESKDWRVVINSVSLAASDAVLAANEFNDPPAAGSEYILVNYSVTYLGDDANGQTPSFVSVEYVTQDGKTINSFDNHAVAPKALDSNALYKGGTATGNVALQVPTATADKGVLAVRPGMLADKVFVAVK